MGYFYKEELKIREPSQPTEGSRVFVRGRCQLNPGQNAANSGSNGYSRKVNRKFQEEPQAEVAANPRDQEEEKSDTD